MELLAIYYSCADLNETSPYATYRITHHTLLYAKHTERLAQRDTNYDEQLDTSRQSVIRYKNNDAGADYVGTSACAGAIKESGRPIRALYGSGGYDSKPGETTENEARVASAAQ